MKKLFIAALMLLVITSCCKEEELTLEQQLIGTWQICTIDPETGEIHENLMYEFPSWTLTSHIHFFEDGTGEYSYVSENSDSHYYEALVQFFDWALNDNDELGFSGDNVPTWLGRINTALYIEGYNMYWDQIPETVFIRR